MNEAKTSAPHRLSPSSFGKAFEVACERQFKLSLLTKEQTPEPWLSLKLEGERLMKERLTTVQILAGGYLWEEEALSRPEVVPHLVAPPGEGPLTEREWGEGEEEVTRSLEVLREAPVGSLVYQLKLRPPPSLYARLGLNPDEVELRDNLPDLVQVLSREQVEREALGQLSFMEWLRLPVDPEVPMSERVFRVIDLKRSAKVRPSHRAQVLYYALEIDELIELGQVEGSVDLDWGGVWLGGEQEPERVNLLAVAPYVLSELKGLPRLLQASVDSLDWDLNGRCERCNYWSECAGQAIREDHLSRLTGLSRGGADAIRALGVETVEALPELLSDPAQEARLSQVASLDGRLSALKARAESYRAGQPVELRRLSQVLPQGEDIAVFLTIQQEPVSHLFWGYGLLVRDDHNYLELPKEPYALTVGSRAESFEAGVSWLSALDQVWSRVNQLNKRQRLRLTLQVYCYSDLERRLLQRCLTEMRAHPSLSETPPLAWSPAQRGLMDQISRALYVIQGAELMGERSHPKLVKELPVVPLLSALVGRYALPVDVVYTLPEVVEKLAIEPAYPRDQERHDPYNHQLRPDAAIELWSAREVETAQLPAEERGAHEQLLERRERALERCREDISARLSVYSALLTRLRAQGGFAQVRRLSAFTLPDEERLAHPDLSRLAYLTRQERISERRGVKQVRFEGAESARRYGTLTRLRACGDARFEVLHIPQEQSLSVGGFGDLILVEATEDGLRRAAMISDDEAKGATGVDRAAFVKVMKRVGFAQRGSEGSSTVEVGDLITLCEASDQHSQFGFELPTGLELFLCQRFQNFTDHKLHRALKFHSDQYERGQSLFVQLLEDPCGFENELRYPPQVAESLKSSPTMEQLTESQRDAWRALSQQKISAIWGPPGTGKTHFLASYLLGVIYAYEQVGAKVNVVLSAMTNAGIDNLIDKVAELAWAENQRWGAPLPILIRGKKAQRSPTYGVHYVSGKHNIKRELQRVEGEGSVVLGVTQWALADLELGVDLLVIDEASQLLVQQASIGFTKLRPEGRVIVAGDHKQLGPVLSGDWGRDEVEERLAGSIFDLIRGREGRSGIKPQQLLENFRMSRPLTALSQAIYGPNYVCASEEVAQRRLTLDATLTRPARSTVEGLLARLQLDPAQFFEDSQPFLDAVWSEGAVSLVILEGTKASRVNPLESALVGLCVESLRLATPKTTHDGEFWSKELFVIGPHNRQNDLSREALRSMRSWSAPPFVQTVDKAQGQEARCVIISYGVSELEFILAEQDFIYDLNRLNVSITRAQAKLILFLSRELLDGDMSLLSNEGALAGLSYMQRIESTCRALGSSQRFSFTEGLSVEVLSLAPEPPSS